MTSAPVEPAGGNRLRAGRHDLHALLTEASAELFAQGTLDDIEILEDPPGIRIRPQKTEATYLSRTITAPFPFNELVPSWNVDLPDGAGFAVEIRFFAGDDREGSPFCYFGSWGDAPALNSKLTHLEGGGVNIDYLHAERTFDRLQYRFHLKASPTGESPVIRRVALACSNTLNDAALARRFRKPPEKVPVNAWARRLPVPWRSQMHTPPELRSEVCSPTSTAMVLAYHGVEVSTERLARIIYDREYEIYGNWARAVQAAHLFGRAGYLQRFGHLDEVKPFIARGQPVIASTRIARGQLVNMPDRRSAGHLMVIVGFDADGNVHINDPAYSEQEHGRYTLTPPELNAIWIAHGGVGYVIERPGARTASSQPANSTR